MKVRASAFIATSLDGFIARSDGSIDWLDDVQALIPEGEDCGYLEFMASIDGLVMGRHTFERALKFEEWPYGQLPVYVMSHAPVSVPAALVGTVHSFQGSPEALVARLSKEGFRHVYVGRALFGPLSHDVELSLLASRAYEFGFVQSTYRIEPATGVT
jgi:dihydrofolate reductase